MQRHAAILASLVRQPLRHGHHGLAVALLRRTPIYSRAVSSQKYSTSSDALNNLLDLSKDSDDIESTFYQRALPVNLERLSSPDGKRLFRASMEEGHAEGFFPLTDNYTTQSDPSYCGPSSLAMVLNAMGVDPKRRWKGVWRWYSDELLECCSNKEDMKKNGITFNEFACLAKCHCNVIAKRIYNVSFEEFKKDVETITTRSNQFMVVSFSRKGLGQTGDGHFSPIAAYNQKDQKVLILDTARFKYPSFWCPIETLYESMKPIDKETGRSRGYFLLSYDSEHPPINLCKVSKNTTSQEEKETTNSLLPDKLNWSTIAQGFCKKIPENMALENPATLEQVVKIVLRNVPTEYTTVLLKQSIANTHSSDAAIVYINQLMQDITHFSLYPIVLQALYPNRQYSHSASPDTQAAFSTLFIMGSPFTFYTSLPRELQVALKQHRDRDSVNDRARHEIDRVSLHVNELTTSFCVCSSDGMKEGVKINKVC